MRLFGEHEQIVVCTDRDSGLRAIIAVHDTTLGPGLGGIRMWTYSSDEAALTDVLRLSEGMTYKNALATIMLAVTIVAIAVTGVVLRRSSQASANAGDDPAAAGVTLGIR